MNYLRDPSIYYRMTFQIWTVHNSPSPTSLIYRSYAKQKNSLMKFRRIQKTEIWLTMSFTFHLIFKLMRKRTRVSLKFLISNRNVIKFKSKLSSLKINMSKICCINTCKNQRPQRSLSCFRLFCRAKTKRITSSVFKTYQTKNSKFIVSKVQLPTEKPQRWIHTKFPKKTVTIKYSDDKPFEYTILSKGEDHSKLWIFRCLSCIEY
jgi:hypothetical protein